MDNDTQIITRDQLRQAANEWFADRLDKPKTSNRSQFNHFMRELGELSIKETLRTHEGEDELYERLDTAYGIIHDIWYSVAPDSIRSIRSIFKEKEKRPSYETDEEKEEDDRLRHGVWHRRDPKSIFYQGVEQQDYFKLDNDSLDDAINTYLQRPWLRHPTIDWVLMDIMVTAEVVAFGESIKLEFYKPKSGKGFVNQLVNRHYLDAKGNLRDMESAGLNDSMDELLKRVLWLFVLPLGVVGVLYYYELFGWAFGLGGAYFALLGIVVAFQGIRGLYRHITGWERPEMRTFKKWTSLWDDMMKVHKALEGPIINPGIVKAELVKSKDKGAGWDNAAFALIDRVATYDGSVWIVWPDNST